MFDQSASDIGAPRGAGGGVGGGGIREGNGMDENAGGSIPRERVGTGVTLLFRRYRFSRSLAAFDLIYSFMRCEAISHRTGSFGASRGALRCTFGSVSPALFSFDHEFLQRQPHLYIVLSPLL